MREPASLAPGSVWCRKHGPPAAPMLLIAAERSPERVKGCVFSDLRLCSSATLVGADVSVAWSAS